MYGLITTGKPMGSTDTDPKKMAHHRTGDEPKTNRAEVTVDQVTKEFPRSG
jgi:hypothetical protein